MRPFTNGGSKFNMRGGDLIKKYCPCCGRQVVSYNQSDEHTASGTRPKRAVNPNELFCDECGEELDENGLFPEEAAQYQ